MKTSRLGKYSARQIALGILAVLVVGLLAGCVVTSVYPYYTAKDVVFNSQLVGRWGKAGAVEATDDFWEFARAGTNASYTLTVHEGDASQKYAVHLFRLQPWLFLDALPLAEHDDFVPPHYLLKITQIEPTLKMALLDPKWLDEQLERQPGMLRHLRVGGERGGRLVLTANTAELQAFLRKRAHDTNVFAESLNLSRRP